LSLLNSKVWQTQTGSAVCTSAVCLDHLDGAAKFGDAEGMTTYKPLALLCLVASMTFAACGGASTESSAAKQPAAERATAVVDAPQPAAPAENAQPASKYRVPKDFELSAEQVELPGIPMYPGSATLSLPGVGPRMGGNSDKGSATSVSYVLEDGATWSQVGGFYKEKLEADGWKEIGGQLSGKIEDLPIGILSFEKDKLFVNFQYGDSTQTKAGPILNVIYTAGK
jgi:hypothetical protein